MGKKLKINIAKLPILLLLAMLIGASLSTGAYAQTNDIFWANTSNEVINDLSISTGETRTVRLMAYISDGTLNAFKINVSYDSSVVSIKNVKSTNHFGQVLANTQTAGQIILAGFSVNGVSNNTTSFVDVTLQGVQAGQTSLQLSVEDYGTDPTTQMTTSTTDLPITVSNISAGNQEVYWANTSNVRIDELTIPQSQMAVVRLMGEVPDGETLNAVKFTITYDSDMISIEDVKSSGGFGNLTINDSNPEEIIVTGFNVDGVQNLASFIDLTVYGKQAGSTVLNVAVNDYGSEGDVTFIPDTANVNALPIQITNVYAHEIFWTDSSGMMLSQLDLAIDESRTIRLVSYVPAGQLLKAFSINLIYDPDVIQVTSYNPLDFGGNTTVNIETDGSGNQIGLITVNGFSDVGIDPGKVEFLDLRIIGAAQGSFNFEIDVDEYGRLDDNDQVISFKPQPVSMWVTVNPILPGTNELYWLDNNGERIEEISLDVNETGTVTLVAEVPEGKTLNAFKIVLTYDSSIVSIGSADVVETNNFADDPNDDDYRINVTDGKIVITAFDVMGVAGPAAIPLVDITMTGINDGAFYFHQLVTEFGSAGDDEFKPITNDLYVIVGSIYHTITATAGMGGTISPSGSVSVEHLMDQTFTILANSGYRILNIYIDGVSLGLISTTTYTYTFPAVTIDHTIEVTFVQDVIPKTYIIEATSGDHGSIFPSGLISVISGGSQIFTMIPDEGYTVEDVVVDGASVGAVSTYTVSNVVSNRTIHVTFTRLPYCTVMATTDEGGIIDPAGSVEVTEGTSRLFTFSAMDGYSIVDVLVNGNSIGAVESYNFTCDAGANATIHLVVEPQACLVTTDAGNGGTITPSGENIPVGIDGTVQFNISPMSGYRIVDVTLDGESLGDITTYVFTCSTNTLGSHVLAATFVPLEGVCAVTATANAGGTIAPSGLVEVETGAVQQFKITPNQGLCIRDVLVDGESVGAVSVYNFSCDSESNHTIEAIFGACIYTIQATAGTNGTITPSGAVQVPKGGNKNFIIKPNLDYRITDVKIDGTSIGNISTYMFKKVERNHTISASFGLVTGGFTIQGVLQNIPAGINPDDIVILFELLGTGEIFYGHVNPDMSYTSGNLPEGVYRVTVLIDQGDNPTYVPMRMVLGEDVDLIGSGVTLNITIDDMTLVQDGFIVEVQLDTETGGDVDYHWTVLNYATNEVVLEGDGFGTFFYIYLPPGEYRLFVNGAGFVPWQYVATNGALYFDESVGTIIADLMPEMAQPIVTADHVYYSNGFMVKAMVENFEGIPFVEIRNANGDFQPISVGGSGDVIGKPLVYTWFANMASQTVVNKNVTFRFTDPGTDNWEYLYRVKWNTSGDNPNDGQSAMENYYDGELIPGYSMFTLGMFYPTQGLLLPLTLRNAGGDDIGAQVAIPPIPPEFFNVSVGTLLRIVVKHYAFEGYEAPGSAVHVKFDKYQNGEWTPVDYNLAAAMNAPKLGVEILTNPDSGYFISLSKVTDAKGKISIMVNMSDMVGQFQEDLNIPLRLQPTGLVAFYPYHTTSFALKSPAPPTPGPGPSKEGDTDDCFISSSVEKNVNFKSLALFFGIMALLIINREYRRKTN